MHWLLTCNTCRNCCWFLCCYNIIMRHFCTELYLDDFCRSLNYFQSFDVIWCCKTNLYSDIEFSRMKLKSVKHGLLFYLAILSFLLLLQKFASKMTFWHFEVPTSRNARIWDMSIWQHWNYSNYLLQQF